MFKSISLFLIFSFFFISKNNAQDDCPFPSASHVFHTNNIRTMILNGGDLHWNLLEPKFQAPYVDENSPGTIFSAGLWLSSLTPGGALNVSSVDYRSPNESSFLPGPLSDVGLPLTATSCSDFNKIWSVTGDEIQAHIDDYNDNQVIDNPNPNIQGFPCKGNPDFYNINGFELPESWYGYASFFDRNGNGIYESANGEYPKLDIGFQLIPDQLTWCVFNDAGTTDYQPQPNGLEIQLTTWAIDCPDDHVLGNTIFTDYKIINKHVEDLDSFHIGMWVDFDLGCYTDDYLGCDTNLNTFYVYNVDNFDGDSSGNCDDISTYMENPPVQAVTFLNRKMDHFVPLSSEGVGIPPQTAFGNGQADEIFNLMTGTWADGTPWTSGESGYNPNSSDYTSFIYPDNPNDPNGWSMQNHGNSLGNARALATNKYNNGAPEPLPSNRLNPGAIAEFSFAWSFHRGENLNKLGNVNLMLEEVGYLHQWWMDLKFNNLLTKCPEFTSTNKIDFEEKVSIFPNPTSGELTIDFQNHTLQEIQIIDATGRIVFEEKEKRQDQFSVQLSHLSDGIYFIKGKMADGVFYKKVMVAR